MAMFQSFETTSNPANGPARLAALRGAMQGAGLDGFIVPRADAHQGEYVADCDARLEWLTGFTGSAGFCIALRDVAGVFVDGRYRVQVKSQVALSDFSPVNWPEVKPSDWLPEKLPKGGTVGFDPWLHTVTEIEGYRTALEGSGISVQPTANLVDLIWTDRPVRPASKAFDYGIEYAGKSSAEKRGESAVALRKAGQSAAVLTLPDSIAWLLNIRGADLPRVPVIQCFAILTDQGRVLLFTDPAKLADLAPDPDVEALDWEAFEGALATLHGTVRIDKTSAPLAVSTILQDAGVKVVYADDPCRLPKACKNSVEVAGMAAAHLRDGAAMVEFLAWLDDVAPKGGLTEIDVVRKLEGFRRATNALRDISFDTILGSGPHGAIMHYRVTEQSNRQLRAGELVVIDSGGQYLDGTTDITRTVVVRQAGEEEKRCFTRVLQGMIAISRIRWPRGVGGSHLDVLARAELWMAGQDFDHGTGHGVGHYLSVHEGPQRLSRTSDLAFQPGMILSNEPGYYREGAFGIRIENLVVVKQAPALPGGDDRAMLDFDTLTYVPIDRRLIVPEMMTVAQRDWLNQYHAEVLGRIGPHVSDAALAWLRLATAPI